MLEKLARLLQRLDEVEAILADPAIFQDQDKYKAIAQEHSYLNGIKEGYKQWSCAQQHLKEHQQWLAEEQDSSVQELLKEEIKQAEKAFEQADQALKLLMVPADPLDDSNVIVELRAGTGGEEAALFVADCVRMYQLYADHKQWKYEVLSCNASDLGGFKEFIMVMSGKQVKRYMQYEAGTHRVQRVPKTEAQGRVHTSAITVAVLLEPSLQEEVHIEERDLKIDTYRASGAGGQHVNVTDSAVRITHLPTGAVAACQEERSQHKNKEKALRLLKARIAQTQREQEMKKTSQERASQIGSGDRSERIRTYNFPQNRLTDHRIHFTSYRLEAMLQGDLEELSTALIAHFYQEKLLA